MGLLGLLLGEADAEESEDVSVCGLHISVGLDQGLPLLNHGPELVGGEAHAVKVGQTVLALDVFTDELELLERPLGILLVLKISQRDFIDASLESIRSDPGALGSVHQGLSDIANLEGGWGLNIVPVFAGERIDNLFFHALLASFGEAL